MNRWTFGVCVTALLAMWAGVLPAVAHETAKLPAVADLSAHRAVAMKVVLDASRSEDALQRAVAIEAVQFAPDHALPMTQLALEDSEPGVRFAALYTVGKLRLAPLVHAAKPLFNRDEPAYVQVGVIFAAARCGAADDKMIGRFQNYLQDPDPRVRANAAMLLGELGNDTAIPLLRRAGIKPAGSRYPGIQWTILRVQVAEALAKLGDARAMDSLHGAAYSQFDEVRIMSVQILGRLGDDSFWGNMNNFLMENPVEFRLAAAEGLARLGRFRNGMLEVMLEGATHKLATVRVQACFALGQYDHASTRAQLAHLLKDDDPMVRLAAAAAVLEVTAEAPAAVTRGH